MHSLPLPLPVRDLRPVLQRGEEGLEPGAVVGHLRHREALVRRGPGLEQEASARGVEERVAPRQGEDLCSVGLVRFVCNNFV